MYVFVAAKTIFNQENRKRRRRKKLNQSDDDQARDTCDRQISTREEANKQTTYQPTFHASLATSLTTYGGKKVIWSIGETEVINAHYLNSLSLCFDLKLSTSSEKLYQFASNTWKKRFLQEKVYAVAKMIVLCRLVSLSFIVGIVLSVSIRVFTLNSNFYCPTFFHTFIFRQM